MSVMMTTKCNNSTAAELVRQPNTPMSIIIVSTDIDNLHIIYTMVQ